VGFRAEGSNEVVPGGAVVREVIVNPETVTRVYSGEDFTVRETLFVPLGEAGFEILYQVDSRSPLHIAVSFRPDLDLMWPGGIGGQSYFWDAHRHAFTLVEVEQSSDHITLRAEPRGSPVEIEFAPQIPLGSRTLRAVLNSDQPLPVSIRSKAQDAHAEVKFTLHDKSQIVLKLEGGMQPCLPPEPLHIGDVSHGARVKCER
jgi:hypothetical protein